MTGYACLWRGRMCCSYCWQVFGDEGGGLPPGIGMGVNALYGEVWHAVTGDEYECVADSAPGTPLAHPDCYKRWAESVNDTDATLWDFVGDDGA